MGKQNITFDVILKLKTTNFTNTKRILINDVDIGKTVVSNRFSLKKKGFKYFNGYADSKKVRSLS